MNGEFGRVRPAALVVAMATFVLALAVGSSVFSASAAANVTLSPQIYDFGVVKVGSKSAPLTFSVRVSPDRDVKIVSAGFIDQPGDQYTIESDDCSGQPLSTYRKISCSVTVRFTPKVRGNHLATFQIEPETGWVLRAYILGSGVSAAQPPTGSGTPSARCVKAKSDLVRAKKNVRQTKRKLRKARTPGRRQAIRKRLVARKLNAGRLGLVVIARCGR